MIVGFKNKYSKAMTVAIKYMSVKFYGVTPPPQKKKPHGKQWKKDARYTRKITVLVENILVYTFTYRVGSLIDWLIDWTALS